MNIIYIKKRRKPSVITDQLVLHLDIQNSSSFTNSGNVWYDISGEANHATWQGGSSYVVSNTGELNDGTDTFFFNSSTTSYFLCANNTPLSTNTGTFSIWFTGIGVNRRLAGQSATWEFLRSNEPPNYRFDLGGSNQIVSSTTGWGSGVWQNMVVTWDSTANTSKLYRNGSLVTSGTSVGSSSGALTIGRSPGGVTQMYNGSVSHVLYYHKVLSATEVEYNYDVMKNNHI